MYQRLDLKALGIHGVGPLFQSHDPLITLPEPPENEALDPIDDLTHREREVLGLMAEGLTNAGVAQRLVLTERTVETHVSRILAKLGLAEAGAADHRRVLAVLRYLEDHRVT